ncbi:Os11g0615350 [Oryza sativa Japonica Group]|uniref:Os11g0615350 protein n=2 Tax=Oryza sativa subsp. japonica TaxID=39947 RepID=C7J8A0_ORYSJ|nr:hypothetical protein EE612_056641 [Oryza sativa]BAH95379.1 Os11g0615350 [Oryza sativa Japonica Group]BAT14857.1 Os11g0615350 [Oryza sativa Japonica Group]|eukprot:NP_001176651.1 Os11g0615350 [Oryza sativa Japonica Group]
MASASASLPAGTQPSVAELLDARAATPASPSLVTAVSAESSGQRHRPPLQLAPDHLLCPAATAARWNGAPAVVSAAFSVSSPPLLHLTHVCMPMAACELHTDTHCGQELRYLGHGRPGLISIHYLVHGE